PFSPPRLGHEPVAQTSAGRSWSTGSDSVSDSVSELAGRSGQSNIGFPFSSHSTTTGTSQAAWTSGISTHALQTRPYLRATRTMPRRSDSPDGTGSHTHSALGPFHPNWPSSNGRPARPMISVARSTSFATNPTRRMFRWLAARSTSAPGGWGAPRGSGAQPKCTSRCDAYGEPWRDKVTCTLPRASTKSVLAFRLPNVLCRYRKSTSRMFLHLRYRLAALRRAT